MLNRLFRRPSIDHLSREQWDAAAARMPFLGHLSQEDHARLYALAERFLEQKAISGAAGFEVTDEARATIALQACLPVLELGLDGYRDFVEIVVYPDRFLVPRTHVDDAGVVTESTDALAGEAMDGGPVVLSWNDAVPDEEAAGWNLVIHEFVHKLDMLDGEADGVPPLPPSRRAAWQRELARAYEAFCRELDRVEERIPPDVDPESPDADDWYMQLPLDPYAATDPGEFFAVAAEAFFTAPEHFRAEYPELYREFSAFFRQDPAAVHPFR